MSFSNPIARRFGVWLLLAFVAACQPASEPAPKPINPAVELYLRRILDAMEANSINRKTIDWAAFRNEIMEKAAGAQSNAAAYLAIQLALTRLGDQHSFFRTPDGQVILGLGYPNCQAAAASAPPPDSSIGYVKVSAFTKQGLEAMAFAETIQNTIRKADKPTLRGWIVDLRGNLGGNMWPMLAGVGPILGEGVAGYFIDPNGQATGWGYEKASSVDNGSVVVTINYPYQLIRPSAKVAVLTDGATTSSGEAIAIAFRERPNTRSFGAPTCGQSTANRTFAFTDGATLNLTVAVMADRTRKVYGKSLAPDVPEDNPEAVVRKALEWLKQ